MATLTALRLLTTETIDRIRQEVRKLRILSQGSLSIRTATELVTNVVVELYNPILAKLDPIQLGEMQRALKITEEYGHRLLEKGQNINAGALKKLIEEYPTHSFIIDEPEARQLFKWVRPPSMLERMIALSLGELAHKEKMLLECENGLLYLNLEDASLSINEQFSGNAKLRAKNEKKTNSTTK